jgi:hypothetical protein
MGSRPTPRPHLCRPTKQVRRYAPYTTLEPWQSEGPETRRTPARKGRAMGRIEHTLLDGETCVPNRPKTFAYPYHTTESDKCFYLEKGAETPPRMPGPVAKAATPLAGK